jgi:hypothetical protein
MQQITQVAGNRLLSVTGLIKSIATCSALLVLLMLLLPGSLSAQQTTADVIGTITDAGGAALPGATVTIRNLGTNDVRTVTSNDRGDFSFNLLPNGRYSLKVESTGFKVFTYKEVSLSVGDRTRLNAKLEVGTVTESVSVSADEAAALKTDDATVGSTLDEKTVQDLPLNGRNFMGMVNLAPGVTTGSGNGNWSQGSGSQSYDRRTGDSISANGKSEQLNNNEVDGFDNNDRALGLMGLRPSMDGIQEVKVDTSSYAAESGRTAGAVTNVITKSGTNKFHGSAYDYIRNDMFDASDYFATKKPKLRLNQFGGSVGGPIQKDKTFFFFDIEEDRQIMGLTYTTTIPTQFELDSVQTGLADFSDLAVCPPGPPVCDDSAKVPGPKIAVTSQLIKNYFSLFPSPNNTASGLFTDNYTSSPNLTQYTTTLDARVDHRFKNNDLLFGRYAYNPVTTVYPGPFPYNSKLGVYPNGNLTAAPSNAKATSQQLQLTYTHLFSPSLIGEVKAGYSRINISSLPFNFGDSTPADQKMGFPDPTAYNVAGLPSTNTMAAVMLNGNQTDSAFLGDAASTPYWNKSNNFQYAGSVNWTKGTHNFKFGGGVIQRQMVYNQTGFAQAMFITVPTPPYGNAFMNLAGDTPTAEGRQVQMVLPLYLTSEPSFYAQDSWRVNQTLTLNLGVRYDIFTPYSEKHGKYSNFDLSTLSFVCGKLTNNCTGKQSSTIGVKTDYKDFSPRIGFAQTIGSNMVLRGAFAMSYFPADIGALAGGANLVQNVNPPYYFSYNSSQNSGVCTTYDGPGTASMANTCALQWGNYAGQQIPNQGLVTPVMTPTAQALSTQQVTNLTAKDPNLRSSYLEQWNLSVQRQFGAHSVTLAYVGDTGRRLLGSTNANNASAPPGACATNDQMCPSTSFQYSTAQIGPYVTNITHIYNRASENYNAMQVIYSLRASKGLSLGANYVWAHGMGTNTAGKSNNSAGFFPGNPKFDYGNLDLDVRQRITFHGSYEFPFATNAKGLKAIVAKGWKTNMVAFWQVGMPFTVIDNATIAGGPPGSPSGPSNGNCYTDLHSCGSDRPNVIAATKISNRPHKFNPRTDYWFNIKAFQAQTIGTIGNEGVNQIVGAPDRRIDLSFEKDFAFTQSMKLQFRAESFNITNTTNYGAPQNNIYTLNADNTAGTDNSFGKITGTAWGENPRQFQFALKLLF